jgi:hypothetical protein
MESNLVQFENSFFSFSPGLAHVPISPVSHTPHARVPSITTGSPALPPPLTPAALTAPRGHPDLLLLKNQRAHSLSLFFGRRKELSRPPLCRPRAQLTGDKPLHCLSSNTKPPNGSTRPPRCFPVCLILAKTN